MAPVRVGLAKVDITPPLGVELCGFGPFIHRHATDVLEPLYARAMVLEQDGRKLALVACDLIGIEAETAALAREHVEQAVGLPPEAVMICCTHTHSGPATVDMVGWGEPDKAYCEGLPGLIARAVERADKERAPARLEWGEAHSGDLSCNRVDPDAARDERLAVLGFRPEPRGRKAWLGFAAHVSCHPTVMCERTALISGDFVWAAVNKLERELHVELGAFIQGALGDINAVSSHKPQAEALGDLKVISARLQGHIRTALDSAEVVDCAPFAAARKQVVLPQVVPEHAAVLRAWLDARRMRERGDMGGYVARYQRFVEETHERLLAKLEAAHQPGLVTEIQGFRLGDVMILAQPGEMFFSFYQQLRERLAGVRLVVTGPANDFVGYIPSADNFDLSARRYSYAAHFVPVVRGDYRFAENVGDVLVDELVSLADALRSDGQP